MKMLKILCFIFLLQNTLLAKSDTKQYLQEWNQLFIDLMVKDGFSPVLATRGFIYPNLAAYESIAYFDKNLIPLGNVLNKYSTGNLLLDTSTIYKEAVMVSAIYEIAKEVMYRTDDCNKLYEKQFAEIMATVSLNKIQSSKLVAAVIVNNVKNYMKQDGYNETKALPNYLYLKETYSWKPTPPEYRNALEPNWKSLRPIIISDAKSYHEDLPFTPDSAKNSTLFQLANEVYQLSKKLTPQQKLIAEYWDDNPDLNSQFVGHKGIPRRHINPASHWMSIALQVSNQQHLSLSKTVQLFTLMAIAMYDTKIVVWHTKYTVNFIRPITYIQQYIDNNWSSLLVTPPFPEHSSGHSACSRACAEVLTAVVGNNIAFTDTTMKKYLALPERTFSSFYEAAKEVSESRILGGIHFRSATEAGEKQGAAIGKLVCKKML